VRPCASDGAIVGWVKRSADPTLSGLVGRCWAWLTLLLPIENAIRPDRARVTPCSPRSRPSPFGAALRAGLDRGCARRRRRYAVGTEECRRRGRTKEWTLEIAPLRRESVTGGPGATRCPILLFGPSGASFRPGRISQQPPRAASVKDGAKRCPRRGLVLDGREYGGMLAATGAKQLAEWAHRCNAASQHRTLRRRSMRP